MVGVGGGVGVFDNFDDWKFVDFVVGGVDFVLLVVV